MKNLELCKETQNTTILICPTFESCRSSNKTETEKKLFVHTWVRCRNIYHCSLKTSMSRYMNGLETNLLLTSSPD